MRKAADHGNICAERSATAGQERRTERAVLPELVTAPAAVYLAAFDPSVGNLFARNAFNMAAFFFADLAYGRGPICNVLGSHAMTVLWSFCS